MKLVSPFEFGICVEDLDRMVGFYRDVLGCEYVTVNEVDADKSAAATFTSDGYKIVRLQLNTGERIKLVAPNRPPQSPPPHDDVLGRRGPAFMTFIVEDLDATIGQLQRAGVTLRTGADKLEIRDGAHLCFAEDPEGNFLEFVEYAELSAYRSDLEHISIILNR